MKRETQSSRLKPSSIYRIFFHASILLSILSSCKNEVDEKKDAETNTSSKDATTLQGDNNNPDFLGGKGKFAVLKLSKNDLIDLFGRSGVQKLLINFSDSNNTAATTKTINAIVYAARNGNNKVVGDSIFLFPENITNPKTWDTTGVQILGNIELSRAQARKALGNVNVIDSTTAADLYFYPIKKSSNHITYIVSKILVPFITTKDGVTIYNYPPGGGEANPSPPATPCDNCNN